MTHNPLRFIWMGWSKPLNNVYCDSTVSGTKLSWGPQKIYYVPCSHSFLLLHACSDLCPNNSRTRLFLSIPKRGQDLVAKGPSLPRHRSGDTALERHGEDTGPCLRALRTHTAPACPGATLTWVPGTLLSQAGFRGISPDGSGVFTRRCWVLGFLPPQLCAFEILCEAITLKWNHISPQHVVVHYLVLLKAWIWTQHVSKTWFSVSLAKLFHCFY